MDKERLWTKMFVFTSIVHFALALSMYLLIVMMAPYTIDTYHTSTSIAGVVSSIFIIGALLGRLYGGSKVEEISKKRLLLIGILLYVIMAFLYFLPNTIETLILIRLIQGIGTGMATTATGTIVSQIIPNSRKGEGIGYFSISGILSTAIGPLIGVFLVNEYGYISIFIFSFVVGVIALLLTLFIKEPNIEIPVIEQDKEQIKGKLHIYRYFEKNAIRISLVTFIAAISYSGLLSFIITYSEEINLTKAGGYYFLVYAIVVIFTRPISGKLMDIKGSNSVVYPTLLVFAVGMVFISQANSSFVLLLGAFFIGLGYGNFQSTSQALAIKVTPIERMGLANTTYFVFLDLPLGLAPLIIGFFVPYIGFGNIYLILAGVVLLTILVYHFVHGRHDKKVTILANEEEYDQIYQKS